MSNPDYAVAIRGWLSGDMTAEEEKAFEAERDADPDLREFCDFMEREWLRPTRDANDADDAEDVDDVDEVEGESPATDMAACEAEWARANALVDEADRRWRNATAPNIRRQARPRVRMLLTVASQLIIGSGWVFFLWLLWFPRLPTGTKVEMTPDNRVVAERSSVAQLMPNPHIASTGNGQKTFGLPGRSTILLRPRSQFTYKGDSSPEMTGTLHGEAVLDVPDGTTWTVYGYEGAVMLGPGLHALFNDQKDHVFRTRVLIGWAAWGEDTVSAGDGGVFIETRYDGPLKVVEDGSRFPKAWGRDAVDRGERYLPAPSFWDELRGRPSDEDKGILLAYMARMSAEERAGGAGMPPDITMGEALDQQRAYERRAAEKAAVAPPNERAQPPARPAPPLVTATSTAGTNSPEHVPIDGRVSCERCTIELQRIATLRAADMVESIAPASTVARDSRGRYYVLGEKGAIMVFGPDGGFLRRISAPGWSHERRSIIGFGVGANDSLYVADSSRQVSVLDPNSFMSVRTFRLPGALTQAMVAADGRLLLGATPLTWDSMPNGTNGGGRTPSASTVRAGDDGLRVIDRDTYYRISADARGGFVVDVFTAQLRRP